MRAAKQREAGGASRRIERRRRAAGIVDLTAEQPPAARAALAAAATVRHQDLGAMRGGEHRLVGGAVEFDAVRFEGNAMSRRADRAIPAGCACS